MARARRARARRRDRPAARAPGAGAAALVPAGAIGRDAAGTFVWRREAEPRRVAVRVLATSGGDAVVDGIAAGDAVLAVAAAAGAPP